MLQGYKAMHMIRKGRLKGMAKGDVLAQNRILAQVFGVAALDMDDPPSPWAHHDLT